MRDRILEGPTAEATSRSIWLVEVGGWNEQLAWQELRGVADSVVPVAPRLASVRADRARLRWLAGSRAVSVPRGYADHVAIPPQLGDALVGSFAVRFVDRWRRLGERDRRRLISLVWRAHPRPVVDLTSPTHDIVVFVHDDRLIFGERVLDCSPDLRMRGRRPFARSYEMPPRTARMLVNSSGTSPGARFLDPFCGTGSLVIEAAIVGTIAIGADVDGSAVRGADLNAGHDGVVATFSVADATRLPLRPESIGSVAADLPYGRSASRRGATGAQLLEATLDALAEPMAPGGQAVLVTLDDGQPQPRPGGWTPSWSLIQPARTLTRRITSWRRSDGAAVSR